MQAARDRQKSYADLKRKPMEFQVGDKVMLKFSPWKGVICFGKWGKLNPRYVGPFKVLEEIRKVDYKLEFPEEQSRVHNTFHVSNLKKCHADKPSAVPLDGLHFDDKLHFVEEPVEIVDREVKQLKQSRIPLVKTEAMKQENLKHKDVGGMIRKDIPKEKLKIEVHNTFHVSNLKKCYADEPLSVPLDGPHIDDKHHFVEEPVKIMDYEVKRLKQSRIPIIKVRLNSRRGPEFTWEREDQFQKKYPHLFIKTAPSSSVAS
nr:putative reverse transcriptase domain-containing protein [Tanacetum cinerariifolium]